MTTISPEDIQAATAALKSSFSYDPPERWLPAYQSLRQVRGDLAPARRQYSWIQLIGIVAMVIGLTFLIGQAVTEVGAFGFWWGIGLLVFAGLPELFSWLSDFVAGRRTPLLRYQREIEAACGPFDSQASDLAGSVQS